jgi:hypothetical protein
MILLLQIVGLLGAAAIASMLLLRETRSASLLAMLVTLAVAFSFVAFWGHAWSLGKMFLDQQSAWSHVSPSAAEVAGAPPEPGFQGPFAEWIRGRIKPVEHVYFVPSATSDQAVYQWFSYRLTPNLVVNDPAKADYFIFYGSRPKRRYAGKTLKLETFAPMFVLGRAVAG